MARAVRVTRAARGVRWTAVMGMLGAVALAGCDSGGDDPVVSPTPTASSTSASPSASSSPSPTPSSTGPDIPAAARAHTPAGAEAFLRFYFDQINVAYMKPQPRLLSSLSTPDCEFCRRSEATAAELAKARQRYSTRPVSVKTASSFGGAPAGGQYLHLVFVQHGAKVVDSAGVVVDTDSRLTAEANAALRWEAGAWKLQGIEKG